MTAVRAFLKSCVAAFLAGALSLCFSAKAASAQTYTLVQGLDKFDGTSAAWHLLEKNGFVVTDPPFKQMFEPYLDDSMPFFITTDSAWHAYHVLLAEGMRQLDLAQSPLLADFSRRLWADASESSKSQGRDFSDLARFAAIGLALQDMAFRASLPDGQKRLAEALLAGQGEVQTEIGFPLWAPAFLTGGRENSKERSGYLAARQWYATVVFRLSDARETRLALCLSWLINKEPDLLQVWKQLSEPYDALLGPAEKGSAPFYWDEAVKMLGSNFTLAALLKTAATLQSRLAKSLPPADVNDQRLAASEGARFGEVIKGFRLLPPRWSSSAVYFQKTAKIPGRVSPSGLDFFVAQPSLRSQAAEQALGAMEGGAVVKAVWKAEAGPLPDSLRGRALGLLAGLQTPLPVRVGPALRSEAWADAQLWAQLGAWTEQEHAEASRGTERVDEKDNEKSAAGAVAPYPDFFAGLGKLALEAAVVLEKAGIDEPFDARTTARKLLECIVWQERLGAKSQEESERMAGPMAQFNQYALHYMEPHQGESDNNPGVSLKFVNDLEALARRCSTQTAPAEADRQVLLNFFQERQTVPKMLRDFAPTCDKLAALARKHLEGIELTDDDANWMGDYGTILQRLQFHGGASPEAAEDDFPIVNRLQDDPGRKTRFYTALGRPQALYIILPAGGRLRLYRGAVLTYREFVRTNSEPLDDASWRALARTGEAPPPPAFTQSFQYERDAAELLKSITEFNPETQGYKEITEALEELQARVADRDLPALIAALGKTQGKPGEPVLDGIAQAIARLHWEPDQRELLALLEKDDGAEAQIIASILLQRPEGLDAVFLSTNFAHAPARARRVYCALLSRLPQTEQTRDALLRALTDPEPAVRWEAATVLGVGAGNAPPKTGPLLQRLSDENDYVAAVAASALGRINATNSAPALLANLEERLQKPEPSLEELRKQNEAVRDFPLNAALEQTRALPNGQMPFDGLRMRRFGGAMALHGDESPAVAALIEVLGDLHYQPAEDRIFGLLDGPHATSAAKALKQLAPERLFRRLLAEACDKKADAPSRDRALVLLGTPPASGSAAELVPLLDDTTIVPGRRPMPGREWRICDRAAETISTLLGRSVRIIPMQTTDQRDVQIEQIRQSLKAAY
jgi:HEAT repeat protein